MPPSCASCFTRAFFMKCTPPFSLSRRLYCEVELTAVSTDHHRSIHTKRSPMVKGLRDVMLPGWVNSGRPRCPSCCEQTATQTDRRPHRTAPGPAWSKQSVGECKEARMVRTKGSMVVGAVREQIDFLKRASRQNAWGIKVKSSTTQ